MANKFDIPSLRQACITFLLPSAAGRPTLGLRIAEENNMQVGLERTERARLEPDLRTLTGAAPIPSYQP